MPVWYRIFPCFGEKSKNRREDEAYKKVPAVAAAVDAAASAGAAAAAAAGAAAAGEPHVNLHRGRWSNASFAQRSRSIRRAATDQSESSRNAQAKSTPVQLPGFKSKADIIRSFWINRPTKQCIIDGKGPNDIKRVDNCTLLRSSPSGVEKKKLELKKEIKPIGVASTSTHSLNSECFCVPDQICTNEPDSFRGSNRSDSPASADYMNMMSPAVSVTRTDEIIHWKKRLLHFSNFNLSQTSLLNDDEDKTPRQIVKGNDLPAAAGKTDDEGNRIDSQVKNPELAYRRHRRSKSNDQESRDTIIAASAEVRQMEGAIMKQAYSDGEQLRDTYSEPTVDVPGSSKITDLDDLSDDDGAKMRPTASWANGGKRPARNVPTERVFSRFYDESDVKYELLDDFAESANSSESDYADPSTLQASNDAQLKDDIARKAYESPDSFDSYADVENPTPNPVTAKIASPQAIGCEGNDNIVKSDFDGVNDVEYYASGGGLKPTNMEAESSSSSSADDAEDCLSSTEEEFQSYYDMDFSEELEDEPTVATNETQWRYLMTTKGERPNSDDNRQFEPIVEANESDENQSE